MKKIKEFIEDYIVWYLYTVPKNMYKGIRHWFYCNWNIEHYRLIKQAFFSYGWDGYFLYELEERQIDKQIKWFSENQLITDDQYKQVLRTLKWAKYLIHVINNETDLFHYDRELEFCKYHDNLYTANMNSLKYFYDGPRLNKRNIKRFLTPRQMENQYLLSGNCDHDLYIMKCKHLYHLVRERYTNIWWD